MHLLKSFLRAFEVGLVGPLSWKEKDRCEGTPVMGGMFLSVIEEIYMIKYSDYWVGWATFLAGILL